jgi:Ca2+-transporting ATPase
MDNNSIKPHKITVDDIFQKYETSENGLTEKQAQEQFKKTGPNRIEEKKQKSLFWLILEQVNNPVIYLLLGAVAVSFIFGDVTEAIAIIIVILLNTIIGFWMEYQAQTSVNALKKLDKLKAHVKRENSIQEIDADKLVPGDFIVLEAGDIIAADARIIFSSELNVDESPLTGESLPVEKNNGTIKENTPLAERTNMLFKGTAITSGKAQAIVTATGKQTEIGAISDLVNQSEKEEIPLNQKLQKLSTNLIWATVGLATLFFVFGWIAGKEIYLLLQTAIAWTVAAIPEGLPIVASIALARGMIRLAKRNVIVKKLAAVETLGETTVIFTDKTGTLTENKLTVNRIEYSENKLDVSEFNHSKNSSNIKNQLQDNEAFQHIFKVSVFCNDAEKLEEKIKGDPLDISLLDFTDKLDSKKAQELLKTKRIHEDPFDSESKFMGTVHEVDNQLYISCKGAVEPVISRSVYYLEQGKKREMTVDFKEKWLKRNNELSAQGLKVISCAYKVAELKEREKLKEQADFVRDMIFIGIICFIDPAKKDVTEAIKMCHQAGIKVIMITGDHSGTAQNIAKKVKLQEAEEIEVMEGDDIEHNTRDISKANLFARVNPKQKHEIVAHFKENGEITAMTGDGVNDAPALKRANIGIAMGKKGTQIAQQVAEMVLIDDSFPSIVEAIEEGRIIFDNIRKFIVYQLSYHLAEIIIIAGISFTLFYIPLLPLQLLFLNLLSDVFPALALGLGKGNENVMKRHPKDPKEPIISKKNWITTLVFGFIIALVVTGVYVISMFYFGQSKEMANTLAFFSLAFSQLLHVFNMREPEEHLFKNQITSNHYIWMALAVCILGLLSAYFVPVLRNTLSLSHLSLQSWLIIGIASLGTLTIIQITKHIFKI